MQARESQSLDLVDVIVGNQLARAGLCEVGNSVDAAQGSPVEIGINRFARFINRKGWMRLVADSRANTDFVDTLRDCFGRRIVRQRFAFGIEILIRPDLFVIYAAYFTRAS